MITQHVGSHLPLTSTKTQTRVLVVDGEPLVRWALSASLAAAGYDVVTAATGDHACEIVARVSPAVVLLDLRPHDRHGQRFFDEIRRVAPRCELLVLTTERRGGASPRWLGAQVIEKPFDLADVVRLVGEATLVGSSK